MSERRGVYDPRSQQPIGSLMTDCGTATWKISLWLCNDQELYNEAREVAREAYEANPVAPQNQPGTAVEEWFIDTFLTGMSETGRLMFLDLLGLVDWDEIVSDLKGDDDWDNDDD